MRVLIADDDEDYRALLQAVLRMDGAITIAGTAGDAIEAIEIAIETCPDVALLDVRMPGGGGAHAARAIRDACPRTRIFALSGSRDRTQVLDMLRAGAVGYATKTATPSEILELIRGSASGFVTLSSSAAAEILPISDPEADRAVRSLLEDEGSFEILLQRIVDLENGQTCGFEALARMTLTPPASPDVWLQRAARAHVRERLELALLERALRCLDRIPDHAYLCVNLSPTVVLDERTIQMLRTTAAERVVVEITEEAPIADYRRMREGLSALRALGVRASIDDVGSGFASLRHILELTPRFVKLDATITRHINADAPRRALVRALSVFANDLDASAIAEGVETAAEVATLRELGIRFGQGFFLGRPERVNGHQDEAELGSVIERCIALVEGAHDAQKAVEVLAQELRSRFELVRVSVRVAVGDRELELAAVWSDRPTQLPAGTTLSSLATSWPEAMRRNGTVASSDRLGLAPAVDAVLEDEGVKSWVSLPLHDAGLIIGLLSFSSSDIAAFTGAEIAILERISAAIEPRLITMLRRS